MIRSFRYGVSLASTGSRAAHRIHCCGRKRPKSTDGKVENEILVETADGEWMLPVTIHTPPPNVSSSSSSTTTLSPILLIAGWTGAAGDWGALPKLLASRTRRPVISHDARWIGKARPNTTDPSSLSLHQMALDAKSILHHLLATLRYEPPFCLLGNSLGGMVAQLLVAESSANNNNPPPPISSMILISTGSVAKPDYPASTDFLSSFDSWEDNDGGSSSTDTQRRRCAKRFFEALGETYLEKPGRLKMRDRLVEHFVSTRHGMQAKEGIDAQKQALLQFSPTTTAIVEKNIVLPPASPPTFVLHGRNDRVFDYRNAYLLQDSMGSSCEVVVLPDSDHLLILSDTASVVSNVESFLKDK